MEQSPSDRNGRCKSDRLKSRNAATKTQRPQGQQKNQLPAEIWSPYELSPGSLSLLPTGRWCSPYADLSSCACQHIKTSHTLVFLDSLEGDSPIADLVDHPLLLCLSPGSFSCF